ncbi:retrovirus-related pol polyprotein from transposon TNT 1-94 [Tanacetum coccineum]
MGLASFSKWILYSGATHYMSHLLAQFISLNLNSSKSIMAANGDSMPLNGIGSVDTPSIALSDVYYIPELAKFSALSFGNSVFSSNAPFDLVHYDVWGSSHVPKKGVADTPPQSTTTTETLPVTILEVTSTGNQPLITITQLSLEVVAVPPLNVRPIRIRCLVEELTTLHQTHTWVLVSLMAGKRAIGSRWVYKIKTKSDGSIERYKARLVAKVLSCCQWKIYQLDVKNAFLNGDLNKEVYMTPPPGVPHQSGEVYKIQKALYGLKQAPCVWYKKFSTVVTSFGFVSSHHDSALFVKRSSVGRILLSLYVDDMIITGDDCNGIELLKAELSHRFAMKDLGLLHYFLGIEVVSSPKVYLLSQFKYIVDLFDRARMTYNKIVDIPLDGKYTPTGDPLLDPSLYRTIVGSLVYLTVTRPYISYVVHIVSQFVGAPTIVHWAVVLQIIRSSTEAEYRVMVVTTSEIVWLRWLLADMGVHITSPTPLYCDNRSAIQIACNTGFHERTKHIEIDCHFTCHHLQAGTISFPFVPSALQIADIFTKPHNGQRFRFLTNS